MKTKLFLSALALAMVTVALLYGSSYAEQKSCSCSDCISTNCTCCEASCTNCEHKGCCNSEGCTMQCCDSKNMSGGVITSSNCCCADCQYQTCARGETCCRDGSCAGCIDNKCCDEKRNTGASCCKGTNKLGGVSGDSAVCIVSGEKLVEGKEVVYSYMGKDYKFCCGDCAEGFKTEPIKFIKEGLTCPIMNEPVKKNVYTVYEGTKYYFCCKMCIKEFEADPSKYLKKESKD